ncbi:hypothetical protein ACXYRP_03505 [Mycoplasma sp. 5912]
MKKFFYYVFFIHKLILKKKNTIIVPIIWIIISIISSIVFSQLNINTKQKMLSFYIVIFVELLITVFFSAIKTINIYKDLEEEGIELLTLSKSISRKSIIWAKTFSNIVFGLYWAVIIIFSNIFILASLKLLVIMWYLIFISLATFFLAYILFGTFTSLIAYKINTKVAITLPILLFSPLAIGGSIIAAKSTSTANNYAYYLNLPYQNHLSGNRVNAEKFYLNNGYDKYYIVPNGYESSEFNKNQKEFLDKAFATSKASARDWQIYSYLITPYQMLDIFNINNANIFNAFSDEQDSNLSKYLFYKNKDSYIYNYILLPKSNLKQYSVTDKLKSTSEVKNPDSQIIQPAVIVNKNAFLVPTALKNQTIFNNLINTNIIYARDGADTFKTEFPEDKFVYNSSQNIVGELKWKYIKELLSDLAFDDYAQKFYQQVLNKTQNTQQLESKDIYFKYLSDALNSENSHLLRLQTQSVVLDPSSLKNKLIKSLTEKKIYLAVALIYYGYFSYLDTKLFDAILHNDINNNYDPDTYTINIDGFDYNIGGYSDYVAKQEVSGDKNNSKIIIRYDLNKSNNYLFTPVEDVYELSRTNIKVVEKNIYFLIWIILSAALVLVNNKLYYRKDYK